jgi:signal peptidase I
MVGGRAKAVGLGLLTMLVGTAAVIAVRSSFGVCMVDGGSMRPALESADLLVTERHPARVVAGDVVVFPRPGWPGGVAHRVREVVGGGLLATSGDANPVPDREPVAVRALLGRVILRIPTGLLARRVASALPRWYTHEPIAQQATTEMRPMHRAVLPGTGPRD